MPFSSQRRGMCARISSGCTSSAITTNWAPPPRHHDELGLAALDELRDLVRPFADLSAFARDLDDLVCLVRELLWDLEPDVDRLRHGRPPSVLPNFTIHRALREERPSRGGNVLRLCVVERDDIDPRHPRRGVLSAIPHP